MSRRKGPAVAVMRDGIVHAIGQVASADLCRPEYHGTRSRRKAWRAEVHRLAANPRVSLLCEGWGVFRVFRSFHSLPRTHKPVDCMTCIAARTE